MCFVLQGRDSSHPGIPQITCIYILPGFLGFCHNGANHANSEVLKTVSAWTLTYASCQFIEGPDKWMTVTAYSSEDIYNYYHVALLFLLSLKKAEWAKSNSHYRHILKSKLQGKPNR